MNKNYLSVALGCAISASRRQANITAANLAKMMGISTAKLGRLERGETMLGIDMLFIASKALNVDPENLIQLAKQFKDIAEKQPMVSQQVSTEEACKTKGNGRNKKEEACCAGN